jgi:hypothetical protein
MKKIGPLLLLLLSLQNIQAQDLDYFLELNQHSTLGDARYTSMSGAGIALSGSMTAIALNPALAGLYRQQSYGMDVGGFSRNYYDRDDLFLRGTVNRPNIMNFGWVGKDPESPLRLFFVYNTDQVYGRKFKLQQSGANSMQLSIIAMANGTPPEFLADNLGPYEDMLYQSYAVDYDPDTKEYFSTADLTDVNYTHELFRKGMRNRFVLGLALAQSPQWYFGGSLSIVTSNETVEIDHRETYNTYTDLNYFSSAETWTNTSLGISGNVGAYYRPFQFLRFGAALELPQLHGFNLDWETTFSATRPSISSSAMSAQGYGEAYQWGIVTAPKIHSGATLVAGRLGLLTVSHSFIPHNWTMSTGKNERYLAEIIDTTIAAQHQLSAGTEWRLGPVILRGGGMWSPAYREGQEATVGYSFGLGVRSEQTTFQMGWQRRVQKSQYYPFSKVYSTPFIFQQSSANFVVGLSWKI